MRGCRVRIWCAVGSARGFDVLLLGAAGLGVGDVAGVGGALGGCSLTDRLGEEGWGVRQGLDMRELWERMRGRRLTGCWGKKEYGGGLIGGSRMMDELICGGGYMLTCWVDRFNRLCL